MHDAGDLLRLGEAGAGLRVEVDAQLVGLLDVGAPGVPRVELDRRHLHRPHDRGELGDAQLVGRAPGREADLGRLDPVRRALGQPLLVDLLAVDALGIAVQHARPLAQRADDAVPDRQVVVDEVELGLAARREVHPVGIADAHGARRRPRAPPPVRACTRRYRDRDLRCTACAPTSGTTSRRGRPVLGARRTSTARGDAPPTRTPSTASCRTWPRSATGWPGCPARKRTAAKVVVWLILIGTALTIIYGVVGHRP